MKKKVKIILGALLLAAAAAGGFFYYTKPAAVETVFVTEGSLTENLQLEGTVTAEEMKVVTATTNGMVTDVLCKQGESIQAGEELVLVDDSEYQQELADEIASLEKQKASVYNQNYMNGLEIKARQEQLIDVMTTARHEYEMMFGENGTVYNDENAAKWAFKTAEASYEAAVETNNDWKHEKKKHPEIDYGDAPFSGAQLAAYESAMAEADAAYKNAQQFSSEKNRLYYEGLMLAYQTQFDTLTELGNYNAAGAGQSASQLQISIAALERKQSPDKMEAKEGGIVAECLVEEGSYVTLYQPLIRIYNTGGKKLEAWMLTEDAVSYQVDDVIRTSLPDGTTAEESITFISPVAEQRVSTLGVNENRCRVELTADNIPAQMGPGYEITLQFERELSGETKLVPVSALVTENQETFVYLVEEGKCRKTSVTTGTYSGGMVEITEGLEAGAEVVDSPEEYGLKDGDEVIKN